MMEETYRLCESNDCESRECEDDRGTHVDWFETSKVGLRW